MYALVSCDPVRYLLMVCTVDFVVLVHIFPWIHWVYWVVVQKLYMKRDGGESKFWKWYIYLPFYERVFYQCEVYYPCNRSEMAPCQILPCTVNNCGSRRPAQVDGDNHTLPVKRNWAVKPFPSLFLTSLSMAYTIFGNLLRDVVMDCAETTIKSNTLKRFMKKM